MKRLVLLLPILALVLIACNTRKYPTRPVPTAQEVAEQPATSEPAPGSPLPPATPTSEPAGSPSSKFTATPTPLPAATDAATPTSIPTPKPSPSPTPVAWQAYHIKQRVRIGGVNKVWMPVPREWDGAGIRNVEILDISPSPTDLFETGAGNLIAFWRHQRKADRTYTIEFTAEMAPIAYSIDPQKIGEYDTSGEEYLLYTQPSRYMQSDAGQITELAESIAGDEDNPYIVARLVHEWIGQQESQPYTESDLSALDALKYGPADGVLWSHLFAALLRARGIPARTVYGLHPGPPARAFTSGERLDEDFSNHVWAEFLLPGYGWIQADRDAVGVIDQHRIVLGRGEDLELGPGFPGDTLPFLHSPISSRTASLPPGDNEEWGESWSLEVITE